MKLKFGCFLTFVIIALITGIVFMVRCSLSNYDNYSVEGSICLMENDTSKLIVYIKDFGDVQYYSSEGGVTNIGSKHKYFLETRDAVTLKLLKSTRLKTAGLQFPKIVGNSNKIIWIHNGQLLTYNPITHEVICDETKLGHITPALLNNFPSETQYYDYDYQNNLLDVFTRNASHYLISENFRAILSEEDEEEEPAELTQLKDLKNAIEERQSKKFNWLRFDSIRQIDKQIDDLKNEIQDKRDFREKVANLHNGNLVSLNDLITSILIKDNMVYTLTPKKEIDTTNHYLSLNQNFSTEEQKFLSKSLIKEVSKSSGMYSSVVVEKQVLVKPGLSFLKGHFLLDKKTLQAVILNNPESFLILSTREIGLNSPLILQRVDFSGKIIWSKELPVKDLKDVILTENKLIMYSEKDHSLNENKQSDLLLCIDLVSGNFLLEALK